jgi:hypothetical protein
MEGSHANWRPLSFADFFGEDLITCFPRKFILLSYHMLVIVLRTHVLSQMEMEILDEQNIKKLQKSNVKQRMLLISQK